MIQTLVSSGHHYGDVMEMSYGDFVVFLKVVAHRQSEHYKMLAVAVRMAGADKKAWGKWFETY